MLECSKQLLVHDRQAGNGTEYSSCSSKVVVDLAFGVDDEVARLAEVFDQGQSLGLGHFMAVESDQKTEEPRSGPRAGKWLAQVFQYALFCFVQDRHDGRLSPELGWGLRFQGCGGRCS